jgi:glycosyltransferase 2 family protein
MKQYLKLGIGILIGAIFICLAFRNVDFSEMWHSLQTANYWYILPSIAILFFSHLLRALRWRYLLDPVRRLDISSLFSSLMIGYTANLVTPAHLGEFLRAYVLSRKRDVSMGCAFGTIVTERIIDVLCLLGLMAVAVLIHPFPGWAVKSGYIMLFGTIGLSVILILLKRFTSRALVLVRFFSRPLPARLGSRLELVVGKFASGVVALRYARDYLAVALLSMVIWVCYGFVFYFCLEGFGFTEKYHLVWYVSLVLLVITTISVVVPSSPGYVGAYHFLCQVTLGMFGVPAGPALSFAAVVHGVMFLPVLVVGLAIANYEGVSLLRGQGQRAVVIEQSA